MGGQVGCNFAEGRTQVLPWKAWVDAEIAAWEALEAAAAKVRLVSLNWEGKHTPTLDKVLTSDQYDTCEEARRDLKLQAAPGGLVGCRGIQLTASLEITSTSSGFNRDYLANDCDR